MRSKILKILVLVGLTALSFGSVPALAEDDAPSASGDIAFLSQYVWRGYGLSDDSIVIQPSATVSYKGFSFNLWGNLDMDNLFTNDSEFNETDMTLSYDWSMDSLSLGIGYIYYGLDSVEDTKEFYFSISCDTILSPSLTIYRDIDAFPGFYANFGIGHSFAFSDDLALDLSASFGYYDVDNYSEFHDGSVSASISFPVGEYMSITPSLVYSFALTDESETNIKGTSVVADSDYIFGGICFSIAF